MLSQYGLYIVTPDSWFNMFLFVFDNFTVAYNELFEAAVKDVQEKSTATHKDSKPQCENDSAS